jgi:RNA polymerase sigma-70 factor (ECF subfamily)
LRNTFLNRLRTQKRKPPPLEFDDERDGLPRASDPRHPEAALEVRELLVAIAELPADQRDAVVAIDIVGLSYREAGQALGAKEATITTRLHRGRTRLAQKLQTVRPGSPHDTTTLR